MLEDKKIELNIEKIDAEKKANKEGYAKSGDIYYKQDESNKETIIYDNTLKQIKKIAFHLLIFPRIML